MIYLLMGGRIGNQLFMYAAAKNLLKIRGDKEEIVVDDSMNIPLKYENSLKFYPLKDTKYVSDDRIYKSSALWKQRLCIRFIRRIERNMTPRERYRFDARFQRLFNKLGVIYCENGLVDFSNCKSKNVVMWGYFQAEQYFQLCKDEIKDIFSLDDEIEQSNYLNLDAIRNRNTVCISIKVQHNVGDVVYDVCSEKYWREAIDYIIQNVENPLFFVCSDNVEYVKEHLIDFNKYDVVAQDGSAPVHISLAVMAQCKHFIIGNTSYGWWAQYLAKNEDKIVIAPSKWYGVDIPCDIYMDNWHLIEV